MNQTIAIDYTAALQQGGGIGRYTRELIAALAAQDRATGYRLFVAGHTERRLPEPPGPNFTWCATPWGPEWFARLWHRARLPIPIERWTGPIALLHAPDFTLPPTRPGTRTLLTVHDLSFVRAPETATPQLRAYLNEVVPRSVARADRILADSESTRQDLIELYDVPPDKISVLYSGVSDRFYPIQDEAILYEVRSRYGIGRRPYIFSVGTVQPRKNYGRLVEALHRLGRLRLKLVIAGGKGWLDDPLYRQIEALGMEDQVQFLGFVPDEDLPALYSAALVFAFPSLYEGFGLPVLEAMACGVPVITSSVSSLPEVAGNAALLVDPYDVDALTEALARVLDDESLRNDLINKGQLRVQGFSWTAAARQLRQHYAALLR
ncbi:MAG TPA: glycosyltransferase family 1 protein [Chloroflexi bacterium]|nr:glycosyltransferase family 1 protein [Chloroflexota bacterium]